MINPTAWNWHNFAGFFWAGTCFLCIVFAYFFVPEPTGRTFAELDLLFERKVPARKFKDTKVDVFDVELTRGNSAEVKGTEHLEVRQNAV
jgi:SP family general alpha glucoside:H+ symporter-like MFS transporter